MGTVALMHFVINEVVKPSGATSALSGTDIAIAAWPWPTAIAALVAGAHVVHGTACGIGERVGNTQMDQMLVNLKLMGVEPWVNQDLSKLKDYCVAVSRATGVPIPHNYPVVGEDAFKTAHGRARGGCHQGLSQE